MTTLEQIWPPFALQIAAGSLHLRVVRDEDIPALANLAASGVHDPSTMPFAMPWTDAPTDELIPNMGKYYWANRAAFSPTSWTLDLAVRLNGEIVGVQGVSTRNYFLTRTGETGSWLAVTHQGLGTGTLMRQAICGFLFDFLDAAEISSAAFVDNPASLAVSRKVGYVDNGVSREQRRPGELAISKKLLLTRDAFIPGPHPTRIEGAEAFRHFVGL